MEWYLYDASLIVIIVMGIMGIIYLGSLFVGWCKEQYWKNKIVIYIPNPYYTIHHPIYNEEFNSEVQYAEKGGKHGSGNNADGGDTDV